MMNIMDHGRFCEIKDRLQDVLDNCPEHFDPILDGAAEDMMPNQPETCSECDACCFSWHDNEWHCGDGSDHMTMDNDIYISVHDNYPLHQERDI